MTVGWLTMIPYICGGIALVVWGRISDRMNERRWNLLVACVAVDRRAGDGRPDHGHLVGAGRHVARGDGLLRLEGPVLRHAADVPERHGAGRGLRLDQLDRQSRRLLRPVVCRRHEGPDRQLRRRPLWAGAAQPGVRSGVRPLPAHPDVITAQRAGRQWRRRVRRRWPNQRSLYRRLLCRRLPRLLRHLPWPRRRSAGRVPGEADPTGRALPARRRHRRRWRGCWPSGCRPSSASRCWSTTRPARAA